MNVETYAHAITDSTAATIVYIALCAFMFGCGWRMMCWGISMRQHGNIWDKPE